MFRLRTESVDDDPNETDYPTLDDAIKAAIAWFVYGYDNDTISRETRIEVAGEAVELAHALRAGKEFHCSKFHELIYVRVLA